MTLQQLNTACLIWMGVAVGAFILLQFITAPYGRHYSEKWGLTIGNKWGWIIMELPSLSIMAFFLMISDDSSNYTLMIFGIWILHYLNRTFIFPLRIHTKDKKMPMAIVGSAIFFNSINAGLNGYYLTYFSNYTAESFYNWNFYVGLTFLIAGLIINQSSDNILISLRGKGEKGYKIPYGKMFRFISCPNHFGEIIQWTGFTLIAWNLPALTFMIWTMANLVPRAFKHHKWYNSHFPEYPKDRKALIPFFW
ncbi:MAG: DUF1295 domain-containing protein [Reichenbachiella sp.]